MTHDEFVKLHSKCIKTADFIGDMDRSPNIKTYWHDFEEDVWCYIYNNSRVIRYFRPVCNHPNDDGYCGNSPSQELLDSLTPKIGRPKKGPVHDRMSEAEVAEVLDKALAIQ